MKKSAVLCCFAMLFSATLMGAGQECDLVIRDGNAAQDLSKILHCLDQRIKTNEVEISDIKRRMGDGIPSGNSKAADRGAFDAGMFSVLVRGASRKAECINIGLNIKNKTTEEMLLAIEYGNEAVLVDEEKGTSINRPSVDGIMVIQYPQTNLQEKHTPVLPDAELPFSLKFCSGDLKSSTSSLFKLNLSLWTMKNKKAKQTTVPLNVTLKGE